MNNSLNVLNDSLDMKLEVLSEIQRFTEQQRVVFEDEVPDIEKFDKLVDEKDVLVDKLISLDNGFEELYSEISESLKDNRTRYTTQIKSLQDKIRSITELSTSIQAQEARNKKAIEEYFAKERREIKHNRVSSRAAYDYYKNMSGMNLGSSGYMDSKN